MITALHTYPTAPHSCKQPVHTATVIKDDIDYSILLLTQIYLLLVHSATQQFPLFTRKAICVFDIFYLGGGVYSQM